MKVNLAAVVPTVALRKVGALSGEINKAAPKRNRHAHSTLSACMQLRQCSLDTTHFYRVSKISSCLRLFHFPHSSAVFFYNLKYILFALCFFSVQVKVFCYLIHQPTGKRVLL